MIRGLYETAPGRCASASASARAPGFRCAGRSCRCTCARSTAPSGTINDPSRGHPPTAPNQPIGDGSKKVTNFSTEHARQPIAARGRPTCPTAVAPWANRESTQHGAMLMLCGGVAPFPPQAPAHAWISHPRTCRAHAVGRWIGLVGHGARTGGTDRVRAAAPQRHLVVVEFLSLARSLALSGRVAGKSDGAASESTGPRTRSASPDDGNRRELVGPGSVSLAA